MAICLKFTAHRYILIISSINCHSTTQTPLSCRSGRSFNFNEMHSFRLSDHGPFIKRKWREDRTKNSCTQKQYRKSDRNQSFLSQCEEKSEFRSVLGRGIQEFLGVFLALIRTPTKNLLLWPRPSANETFSSTTLEKIDNIMAYSSTTTDGTNGDTLKKIEPLSRGFGVLYTSRFRRPACSSGI
ncbi:hypothetical protein AVEN_26967-1 [Araneus ventricosus]|uniref:Uncharacterized protein n=1 Tax=Araneus ventricosus TaxID=182803 RepID=A0A4Y2B8T8_ARAVE|nr:hypothetical protein AVEN_26967-1 [Araneus ventricosus]